MTQRQKILDLIGSSLVATLLSVPLTMITAATLNLNVALLPIFAFSLIVALLISCASHSKLGLVAAFLLAALMLVFAGRSARAYVSEFQVLLGGLLGGSGELNFTEAPIFLSYSIALAFSAILYWMARIGGGFYPSFAITIIVLLGGWFVDHTLNPVYVVPAVAALVCQFARASDERLAYFKILPIALLIALCAFAVSPKEEMIWPPLQDSAEKVRQLFYDYFMFTDRRTAYSLNMDGYLPMGDRLGGPADPRDEAVMEVSTEGEVLLRGSIKRTYTGYSWTDNTLNSRYLYSDFTKRVTRDAVFDSGRAASLGAQSMFPIKSVQIEMLAEATSTLFVPHRLSELTTPFDLPSYFNTSGEVFTTRNLRYGDKYSLTAEQPVKDSKRMAEVVALGAQAADADYASIVSNYTVLPRTVEDEVYYLTQTITQGAQSPFDTALKIQSYLLNNYEYTLDVPYPPDKRDFVSNFLLSEKKGYCTYFASAMAVMGRMAGLPTRYVEGYAIADKPGSQVVTGQNAHAWVEVYFRGIGWLPFNPTPGQGDMQNEQGDSGGSHGDSGEAPADEPPPPGEEQADETTDETPSDPDTGEEENPDEQEKDTELDSEPTPPPEEEFEDQLGDNNEPPSMAWLAWLLSILVILAAATWVFIRIRLSSPAYRASGFKTFGDKLIVWYRAILLLYEQLGQVPESTESPAMFYQRMKSQDMAIEAFEYVSSRLTISRYANNARIEAATFRQAKTVYLDLKKQLKFLPRLNWYKARIFRGLGDFTHLP